MRYFSAIIFLYMFIFVMGVYGSPELTNTPDDHLAGDHKDINMVTITVKAVNQTASGLSVEGDKALITIYHNGEEADRKEARVDSSGKAVFKDIPGNDHFQVVSRIKHCNMMFAGTAINLGSSFGNNIESTVKVYDVDTDNSVLSIGTHHLIARIKAGSIFITEYVQLVNPTDKAVSSSFTDQSGKAKVLELSLPKGFRDFKCTNYFIKEALVITEEGFYDTMAIPPGSFDASFTYIIDVEDQATDIHKKITLPTNEFQLYAFPGQAKINGMGEILGTFKGADGLQAQYYSASSYNPGDSVHFQVAFMKSDNSKTIIIIFIGLIVLVVPFIVNMLIGSKDKASKENSNN